jgi:cytoskeletal protein CcmA (bactofilin family)
MRLACLTELQCAVYADGELPLHEARDAEEHLKTCAACRDMVAMLRAESRILVDCFQTTDFLEFELEDETLSASQAQQLGAVRFAAFVLAMSVLLRPVLNVFESLGLMPNIVNALTVVIPYVVPSGISLFDSVWNNASWIAVSSILLLGFIVFSKRSALSSSILSILAILTVFSSSSYGLDLRSGDKPVTVPQGETVDDTLVVAGDSLTVDGTVTGDVVAFVRELRIRGTVKGNVVSFARKAIVEGTVQGSVFGFAQSLESRGQIAGNLYGFAQSADIGTDARVEKNAVVFASESEIAGSVGKDANVWTRSLHIAQSSRIDGSLTARVGQPGNTSIAPGARILGRTQIQTPQPAPSRFATVSFYVWQIIWLTAAFLAGLLLFWLFPSLSRTNFSNMRELLIAGGWGFVALVALPIAAVIAAITVIGLPIGLIALVAWCVALYLAKIVIAGFVGRSLLQGKSAGEPTTALALLAGLVPIFIGINIPYLGSLINFFLILLGMGSLVIGAYSMPRWRSTQAA